MPSSIFVEIVQLPKMEASQEFPFKWDNTSGLVYYQEQVVTAISVNAKKTYIEFCSCKHLNSNGLQAKIVKAWENGELWIRWRKF